MVYCLWEVSFVYGGMVSVEKAMDIFPVFLSAMLFNGIMSPLLGTFILTQLAWGYDIIIYGL